MRSDVAMAPGMTQIHWLIWVVALTLSVVAVESDVTTPSPQVVIRFTQSVYNVTIPENSIGKTFVTPTTKMGIYIPDNHHLKINYKIVNSSNDLFKAEEYLLGDFSFLLVRTHSNSYGRLNREFRSEYHLKIEATAEYQSGATSKASTDLIVYVTDLNDLQPLFDQDVYSVTVREDTPLHASIAQVSAYDGDAGINSDIYYSFMEKTKVFAVHPTTGIITLTKSLNYFIEKTYTVDILAEDRGPQTALSTRKRPAKFTVTVEQVNFYSPEISLKILPVVIETDQNEILIALASVVDKDIGQNGKIRSLSVVEEDLKDIIIVEREENKDEFIIKLLQNSKSIFGAGFNVTLEAEDMGNNPKTSNKTFFVNLLDTTKSPKFTQKIYEASVEEIVPINTPVMFVSVTETADSAAIDARFEIVDGNEKGYFTINILTGLISTADFLDAENVSRVVIKVAMYNLYSKGSQQLETATVKIDVLDTNDNAPEFNIADQISEIYIQENLPVGSSVFKISAIDKDKAENGRISFSVANVKQVPFDIEPFSGIIKVTEPLDFETMKHTYRLVIRASDWGTPFSRETEMIFKINLQDENDNVPEFEKSHCSGYVSKDAPISTELLISPAIDFDVSDVISYEIQSGNEDQCFELDQATATLTLNCSLRDTVKQNFKLKLVANDGLHISEAVEVDLVLVNSKQSSQLADSLVKIQCRDTNVSERLQEMVFRSRASRTKFELEGFEAAPVNLKQYPPVFNSSIPNSLEISEGASVGTVLALFEASDLDPGYDGMLVYVIKFGDDNGYFKADTHTGGLIVMSELDREKVESFELIIEVSDLGIPSQSATTSVKITVLDENDNPPIFENDEYSATVSENININATVTQVQASDKDVGENADISYTIVSDTDHFGVNPKTGIITVNKALDRERYPVYEILVRASDQGSKLSLSSTATVIVTLTDVNDVVPTFTPEVYSVRIREDLPLGAVVTVVTAADTDEGVNGEVAYHLVYGEDYFEIDSETGVIRIIKKLDFEVQQVHNISVRAEDGGKPPLMSVCFINIEIVDVNENLMPPVFNNFFAVGYVNENEAVGTTVMFVTAHDPDGDVDSVTYSIRDGPGLGRFTIDNNGKIFSDMYSVTQACPILLHCIHHVMNAVY